MLMNLILGMAVSDIEALQKSSAIKRMINETMIVSNMEGFFLFGGQMMPFMDRLVKMSIPCNDLRLCLMTSSLFES